jgi:16S rRNA (guanine1207-N2)-methyltransferase
MPPSKLVLVDSHSRAVEAAEENAAKFSLPAEVILSDNGTPRRMDGTFDVFVGNPPYYSDYRIAEVFLETAKRALKEGGVCYSVCKNAAGLEPVQKRYFPEVEIIPRRGYAVLKSVKPQKSATEEAEERKGC